MEQLSYLSKSVGGEFRGHTTVYAVGNLYDVMLAAPYGNASASLGRPGFHPGTYMP